MKIVSLDYFIVILRLPVEIIGRHGRLLFLDYPGSGTPFGSVMPAFDGGLR